MKRVILYILICIPLVLCGCSDVNIYSAHSEPEELVVIKTIGIDYKDGAVTITAAAGTTDNGKTPDIYSSSAGTLAEAVNGIQNGYQGKAAYFAHAEQIVVGEEAARNGIADFLDYIGRNVYMRLSAKMFVVKGDTAQKLIEETSGEDVTTSDMLEAIGKRSEFMASGRVFTCKDIMANLAAKSSALIYAVEQEGHIQVGAENETVGIKPVGYALLVKGALKEYLGSGVTEGAGIIMGHTKSGMLTVEAEKHGEITLKIIDMKTKCKPVYKDGEITEAVIDIKVKMNIEESAPDLNFINNSLREDIETAAAQELWQTVILAVNKSQDLGEDFCGIGEKLNLRDPYKFRNIYDNWEEIFKDIKITVEISTELMRTYDMENSVAVKGDG